MSTPITARCSLDGVKRQRIITLVANGSSRRVAARFVGCAPSTITHTAMRDPQFAQDLTRAEQTVELSLLRCIHTAAKVKKHWRAAAWLLERRNPQDFALRAPQLFAPSQIADVFTQVIELLRTDLPHDNCRRAIQKLDDLILEFCDADRPLVIEAQTDAPADAPTTEST
jgi:hypothetical protein